MGDLISRSVLLDLFKNLRDEHETNAISYTALYEVILQQKTAYDVEAVVAELEKEMLASQNAQKEAINKMWGVLANVYRGEKDAYKKAISIVRGKE